MAELFQAVLSGFSLSPLKARKRQAKPGGRTQPRQETAGPCTPSSSLHAAKEEGWGAVGGECVLGGMQQSLLPQREQLAVLREAQEGLPCSLTAARIMNTALINRTNYGRFARRGAWLCKPAKDVMRPAAAAKFTPRQQPRLKPARVLPSIPSAVQLLRCEGKALCTCSEQLSLRNSQHHNHFCPPAYF